MDGILTDPLAFDKDPWFLCVGNGVVDLRSGELSEHDPGYPMLKQTLTTTTLRPVSLPLMRR